MNLLSYQSGSVFQGSIINKWLQHEIITHGGHYREALRLFNKYKFNPETKYILVYTQSKTNGPKEINFLRKDN